MSIKRSQGSTPGFGSVLSGFDLAASTKPDADTPDDEFDSATLNGKWTAVNGTSGTVDLLETGEVEKYDLTTRPGWLLIQAGSAAGQLVELRQDFTLGDGESIVAALSTPGPTSETGGHVNNEYRAGISLNSTDTGYDDGTYLFHVVDAQVDETHILAYDGSTIFGFSQTNNPLGQVVFLRIARSGLVYHFYWSSGDGSSWASFDTKTFGTAPDNLWLLAGAPAAGNDPVPITAFKWIRQGTNNLDPWDV